MSFYNPFNKKVSELVREDLERLVENRVAEGWFFECKSAFQSNLRTAHSIAALANSDGGWLVLGVSATKPENIVSEIHGLDLSIDRDPKEKLRNIVKDGVQPAPFFESTLIPLSETRAVLVVRVERETQAPCVTRDGKIYRRVGEGSDPIAETDRYAMQKLFERSDVERERVRKFCQSPFTPSKAEENQCFLEIYFWVPPLGRSRLKNFYTAEFVEKLRSAFLNPVPLIVDPVTANIGLDSFQSSNDSFIFRQVPNGSDHHLLGLTLEVFEDGGARWLIPMPQIDLLPGKTPPAIAKSSVFQDFLKLMPLKKWYLFKVVDGYSLFTLINILFGKYIKLLSENSIVDDLSVKVRISECWRSILFLQDANYVKRLGEFGIPTVLRSSIEMPPGEGVGGGPLVQKPAAAHGLAYAVFQALGCPSSHIPEFLEGYGTYAVNLGRNSSGLPPL